jgi:hypothetical protein
MKRLLLIIAVLSSFCLHAQEKKADKIYLNNGSTIDVTITKVSTDAIKFTYPGETVQNVEKVSNIRTIVFASGRVQQFNTGGGAAATSDNNVNAAPPASAPSKPSVEYIAVKPNMLAILPVAFVDRVSGQLSDENSKLAQARIYDFLQDDLGNIALVTMQDTRTTNALLRKAGIGYKELDETTIEDLQKILGVEYLALSKVSCEVQGAQKSNTNNNKTLFGSNSNTTTKNSYIYKYVVVLELYKGSEKIYNESRIPMTQSEDSWKAAYKYMLKRTPIYH